METVAIPVITPDPIEVGVRPGETTTEIVTIANEGTAPINSGSLVLRDPAAAPWITIINGDFGPVQPGDSRTVPIDFAPDASVPLGRYLIEADILYDGEATATLIDVEVTSAETGQLEFTVFDDTGLEVADAEVSLISEEFLVEVTPQGTRETNQIFQATTDAAGQALFVDVPAGEYRYVISAVGRDVLEGQVSVRPGTTPQAVLEILTVNLVSVDFSVSQTTISDEYEVTLNITYTTNLTKPTLLAQPNRVGLSFFPMEEQQGEVTITNTSNSAPVRELTLDASELDQNVRQIFLRFQGGDPVYVVPELGPGESVSIPYTATMPGAVADPMSRYLGDIVATGRYTFTVQGSAREGTTTTPIPVFYTRPDDLRLPTIRYTNDLRDALDGNLDYQGRSSRLSVVSNRNEQLELLTGLQAVADVAGPSELLLDWSAAFNDPAPLTMDGEVRTFDIGGLEEVLEEALTGGGYGFTDTPHFLRFSGRWADRPAAEDYLVPIAVTTITPTAVIYREPCQSCSSSVGAGGFSVPSALNEHGGIRLQIDQEVTLARQAFDVALNLVPNVHVLDSMQVTLNITRTSGEAADDVFFVIPASANSPALNGGSIDAPTTVAWQIVPSAEAGGTTVAGESYLISASASYSVNGNPFGFDTLEESITVLPMPDITLTYSLPFVIMAGEPVQLRVNAENNGFGTANNLAVDSAQPRLLDAADDTPISFVLNGSSPTLNSADFRPEVLNIEFGDVAPGDAVAGYWELETNRDGYFIEFDATLTHRTFQGVEIDPLINQVTTEFIPAVGGRLNQVGCDLGFALSAVLNGNGEQRTVPIGPDDIFYFSDLEPGAVYQIDVTSESGQVLRSFSNVVALPDQPIEIIYADVPIDQIDNDSDQLSDCLELLFFGDLDETPETDFDGDGLSNGEEFDFGTDPTDSDTDGDGVSDSEEIDMGTDPGNRDSDRDGLFRSGGVGCRNRSIVDRYGW